MSDAGIIPAIERVAIYAVPLLLGVICHEVAHGYAALSQGDPTAKNAGRLNFNPIKHLDPIGTAVFVFTSLVGGFVIGWAKPVPVNPLNFRNPRKGMILVSLAGPTTNLILAFVFGGLTKILYIVFESSQSDLSYLHPLFYMAAAGVIINCVLCIFNLIPVPPLDGSKVVLSLLPRELALKYVRIERYGMILLILLLATGVLGYVLLPPLQFLVTLVKSVFGLPGALF